MKRTSWAVISLLIATLLSACGGGIMKKTINGKTTYHQNGKEISRDEVAAGDSPFARQIARQERQAEFEKALKTAPRRTASEPVSIALLEPIVTPGPRVYRDKLVQYWRGPFKNQKMLPLVSAKKVRKSMTARGGASVNSDWFVRAKAKNVPGDVYVQLIVKTKGVVVRNTETNKISMRDALIYSAEIASPYLEERVVVEEVVINIFKNVEQLNTLAARVSETIASDIRPKLPSAEWLRAQRSDPIRELLQAFTREKPSE